MEAVIVGVREDVQENDEHDRWIDYDWEVACRVQLYSRDITSVNAIWLLYPNRIQESESVDFIMTCLCNTMHSHTTRGYATRGSTS